MFEEAIYVFDLQGVYKNTCKQVFDLLTDFVDISIMIKSFIDSLFRKIVVKIYIFVGRKETADS